MKSLRIRNSVELDAARAAMFYGLQQAEFSASLQFVFLNSVDGLSPAHGRHKEMMREYLDQMQACHALYERLSKIA